MSPLMLFMLDRRTRHCLPQFWNNVDAGMLCCRQAVRQLCSSRGLIRSRCQKTAAETYERDVNESRTWIPTPQVRKFAGTMFSGLNVCSFGVAVIGAFESLDVVHNAGQQRSGNMISITTGQKKLNSYQTCTSFAIQVLHQISNSLCKFIVLLHFEILEFDRIQKLGLKYPL